MSKTISEYLISREKNIYEVVIGLEVHAQVLSNSKLFSSSPTKFDSILQNQTCGNCTPVSKTQATHFCQDCGIFLCSNCSKTIHNLNLFASHRCTKLTVVDSRPNSSSQNNNNTNTSSSPFAKLDAAALRKNHEERKRQHSSISVKTSNGNSITNNNNHNLFSPNDGKSTAATTKNSHKFSHQEEEESSKYRTRPNSSSTTTAVLLTKEEEEAEGQKGNVGEKEGGCSCVIQ